MKIQPGRGRAGGMASGMAWPGSSARQRARPRPPSPCSAAAAALLLSLLSMSSSMMAKPLAGAPAAASGAVLKQGQLGRASVTCAPTAVSALYWLCEMVAGWPLNRTQHR
jgi:hypothetical protein